MSDLKNFNVKNGLSINGVSVIDGQANGTFGVLTANSITITGISNYGVRTVLDDISNQFDNLKCVFDLKVNQSNVGRIVDSKDVEVFINGFRLSPYIKQITYPWITPYDSFKGYRITSNTISSSITIYNAPAPGDSSTLTVINTSNTPQTRSYPYSAATIALGD